jgi:stage V sporulation protein S
MSAPAIESSARVLDLDVPGETLETLKVSTRSNPNSVAGAMAGVVRSSGVVLVQVVGAGALNQAVKAIAIARGYVAAGGIDLVCIPTFAEVEIDGQRRTAIRLQIGHRSYVDGSAHGDGAIDIPTDVAAAVPDPR